MHSDPIRMTQLIEQAIDLADESIGDFREISFGLEAAFKHAGIPVEHRFDEENEIPFEILEQIRGEIAVPLMEIDYQGEKWRIAAIDLPPECDGVRTYEIPDNHIPRWLSLVRADAIIFDIPE